VVIHGTIVGRDLPNWNLLQARKLNQYRSDEHLFTPLANLTGLVAGDPIAYLYSKVCVLTSPLSLPQSPTKTAPMTHAKICIIYYSLYGHIKELVDEAKKGVESTGATATVYQIKETLSAEIRTKMHAPPEPDSAIPVITADKLKEYDGYIFAFPTRYGRAVAQVTHFFDTTGGLWAVQSLSTKFATVITSTGTQHGGHETVALTTIPFFAHHGISYVPIGYKAAGISNMKDVTGGGPFGASTMAGADGSRQVSVNEKEIAVFHGKHFAEVVNKYVA